MKGSWSGPARLHLIPHVADLPVKRVLSGHHFIADLTLPYGRVLHDYLKEQDLAESHNGQKGLVKSEMPD